MGFEPKVKEAANRHHDAAVQLDAAGRRPAAAYLFGLAAECAVKALLEHVQLRPTKERATDPYYAHFPKLRTMLTDVMQGRSAQILAPFADSAFLSEWDVAIRYAAKDQIVGSRALDRRYEKWKCDANKATGTMAEHV